jgi:hypothetical protein
MPRPTHVILRPKRAGPAHTPPLAGRRIYRSSRLSPVAAAARSAARECPSRRAESADAHAPTPAHARRAPHPQQSAKADFVLHQRGIHSLLDSGHAQAGCPETSTRPQSAKASFVLHQRGTHSLLDSGHALAVPKPVRGHSPRRRPSCFTSAELILSWTADTPRLAVPKQGCGHSPRRRTSRRCCRDFSRPPQPAPVFRSIIPVIRFNHHALNV